MISSRTQTLVRLPCRTNPILLTAILTYPPTAQKYKSYNKLRDILSGKLPPPSGPPQSPSLKRKSAATSTSQPPAAQTPSSKRLRTTPSLARAIHLETTPSLNRRLFLSPASAKAPTPTSIGPTPQRDGRVLGLFDLLSGSEETPSRPRTGDFISGEGTTTTTPRKGAQKEPGEEEEDVLGSGSGSLATPRHGRTPMSTSKRAMLDNFLLFTPLKNRDGNSVGGGGSSFAARIGIATDKENGGGGVVTPKGPGSLSRSSLFATPAFLKRGHKPLDAVDEGGEVEEVRPLRLPRKPLVRGLSSVVAGLRKLEEEKLDDEMEAMREAEMDAEGMPPPSKRQRVDGTVESETAAEGAHVVVEDSQATDKPVLLGGFDDENLLDSDVEEQLDRGQPLKVYKKKGQKRTTRRVNMRPTRTRRPAGRTEGGSEGEEEEVVPETQANSVSLDQEEDFEVLSGSDTENEAQVKSGKKAKVKEGKERRDGAEEGNKKEGAVKKAARKVKATANANFKRLKLRNYGAKGGPGVNSRFRRRR